MNQLLSQVKTVCEEKLSNAERLYATVRPWSARQYYGRVRAAGKDYLRRAFPMPARKLLPYPSGLVPLPFPPQPQWLRKSDRAAQHAAGRDVIEGRICFNGVRRSFAASVEWRNPVEDYLWDHQLHAFVILEPLRCLIEDGIAPDEAAACARILMHDWVARCPYPHIPGWHPEVASRRILNWVKFLACYPHGTDGDLHESLSQQAAALEHNIESFLPGSQLMQNGLALAAAGLFFADGNAPRRWLHRGMLIVRQELAAHVLAGGGHAERSPMYHCLLLEGLLDVYTMLLLREMPPLWLVERLRAMTQRLADLLHPDGDVPLFNDTALGHASRPAELLDYARAAIDFALAPPSRITEDDGYVVFRDARSFLIIDGGPIGPENNPCHGHADNLSYELSVGRRRVVVDAGVFSYQPGDMRGYCRGTEAHNTVVVDGCDQSEVWRAFRVGRQARPYVPGVFDHRGLAGSRGLAGFVGGHDGYRRLRGGVSHHRILLHVPERFHVVSDLLYGSGTHRLESHIHLAPGLQAVLRGDRLLVVDGEAAILQIVPFGGPVPQVGYGWHCPRFGERDVNVDIALVLLADLPARFGYFLIPGEAPAAAAAGFDGSVSRYRVEFPGEAPIAIKGVDDRYIIES